MKKFLIFYVLLVNIFIFNTKVYAMQRTNIFIDYYNQEFTTRYDSTFLNKLEDLKETIDSYNIHDRDYVITFNSYRIYIGIALPRTSYTNNYCTNYFIYTLKPSIVSSEYYISYSINRAYCENNGDSRASINGVEILVSDFNNNNYSTQLNTIRNLFINDQSSNAMNLYEGYNISGYNSAWNNIGYNLYYNSVPFGPNTHPAYTIYYATKPIYFNNLSSITDTNNKTKEEVCNIATPSNQWTDAKFIYNDDTMSTELSCGDSITTYYEQMNSAPTPPQIEYTTKYEEENVQEEIKALDIYSKYDTNFNAKLTITGTQTGQILNGINTFKYYGHKCINKTCYWEEINNNTNISNYNEEQIENGFESTFKVNIDTTGYDTIKISLVFEEEKFNIKYENDNEYQEEIDLNFLNTKYSYNNFISYTNTSSLIINSKNGTLNYEMYARSNNQYITINQFKFYPNTQEIKAELYGGRGPIKMGNYWYKGTQPVVLGGNYQLYIFNNKNIDNISLNINTYYNTTDIYYYYNENDTMIYTDNYNGNDITYHATTTNEYINSQLNALDPTDIDFLYETIEDLQDHMGDFNTFWSNLWYEIPIEFRKIIYILLIYGLIAGIFILFKH